ncbi:Hypothetical protein I595_1984 [Croceitalea dokdonensis DOKDO 023]|uniref:HmuY protein n=1 Tax=Croceitalea dokdonensis DOKDO 023 TaxID=1300341 RepID=A0A0N8H443_9FLAO|nr:HmuY family protein [Croceitalea dokdonensis]KPM32332.1 Hypothetical protein I595_1984 [Croceitalea dokdonensis DOKDO 023]
MRTTIKLFGLLSVLFTFIACSDNEDEPELEAVESSIASNIPAPQVGGFGQGEISGEFTKFSFATGAVTDSDTEWDIAFRGLIIIVNGGEPTGTNDEPDRNGNGGATIVNETFESITSSAGLSFAQDAPNTYAIPTGSDNGWYNYNRGLNLVTPIPGRILVVRTHDGKFAKMEILSYYKDAPTEVTPEIANNDFRFYTFRYLYNPNEGETTLSN